MSEQEDCCTSKEIGFKCTCIKTSWASRADAEDDGYGDYLRDREQDRKFEDACERGEI